MFCIFMIQVKMLSYLGVWEVPLKLFRGIANIATRNDFTRQQTTSQEGSYIFAPCDLSLSISYNLTEHNDTPRCSQEVTTHLKRNQQAHNVIYHHTQTPHPLVKKKGLVKQVQLCWWAFVIIIVAQYHSKHFTPYKLMFGHSSRGRNFTVLYCTQYLTTTQS